MSPRDKDEQQCQSSSTPEPLSDTRNFHEQNSLPVLSDEVHEQSARCADNLLGASSTARHRTLTRAWPSFRCPSSQANRAGLPNRACRISPLPDVVNWAASGYPVTRCVPAHSFCIVLFSTRLPRVGREPCRLYSFLGRAFFRGGAFFSQVRRCSNAMSSPPRRSHFLVAIKQHRFSLHTYRIFVLEALSGRQLCPQWLCPFHHDRVVEPLHSG